MNKLKPSLDSLSTFYIRLFFALLLLWMYSITWVLLEYLIYRDVADRLIDNIMMVLLIPAFYAATYAFVPKKKNKE